MNIETLLKELQSARRLAVSLAKEVDVKNQRICELERKCDEKSTTLGRMIAEKDRFYQAFNEEMRKMEFVVLQNEKLKQELEFQMGRANSMSVENDKLKQDLVKQMQGLERRTEELEKQKDQVELEVKHSLVEKERQLELPNHIDGEHSLIFQIQTLKEELSDKIDDLQNMEYLNQTLISRQIMCNDELQDARKEAIGVLRDVLNERTTLRIKRMGEVDVRPFQELCFRRRSDGDQDTISVMLCSAWQENVKNPQWQPFKTALIDGKLKEIIDDDDEKLRQLKNECGEEAYKAVTTALVELNTYNPSGRYIVSEIWNPDEERKASMKEIIQFLVKQWNNNKRKRKSA